MISICIPIFNFDASALIIELQNQIKNMQADCELVLIDDRSDDSYREIHRKYIADNQYIELEKNVGRSKIRNLFLQYATKPYFLFLDCDSTVVNPEFLQNYLNQLSSEPNIVCGGRVYPSEKPDKTKMLRWKYGVSCESQPSHIRKLDPNKSFMTNNFLIKKELFNQIRFEERLTQYGHEDTLFGYELAKKGIQIAHIENPILNGDIETNQLFLEKTKYGIENLKKLLQYVQNDPDLIQKVTLLKTYKKFEKFSFILIPFFTIFNPLFYKLLRSKVHNVTLFNIYKLGVLMLVKE